MSHACSHADLSLLHIGVFITMLVVLSQLVLTWFFASFLMQFFDVFIIIVVWVLLFQICNVSSFLLEFWSIVLLNCILNCWSTVQLAHCFFLLLSLDGGVRCFWWWRDNNATLHFSYMICFLIHYWPKWNTTLRFPFSDFQLKSFVDPKPVELWESAIHQKFCLCLLVWLQK